MKKSDSETWMHLAHQQAARAEGRTGPNPAVGAVIVCDGQVIAMGHHARAGEAHAEVQAIRQAALTFQGDLARCTLYVTLEPCCHVGRTAPCAQAIVQAGIRHVVYGCIDPNPLVSGQGIAYLRTMNIKVEGPVLERESQWLIRDFVHAMREKRPYVQVKSAMSLDGKVALVNGQSQWITGEAARAQGRLLRGHAQAVMIGKNTLLMDNPLLTARLDDGYEPLRIVCDSKLEAPPQARMFQTAPEQTILFTTENASPDRARTLTARGIHVWHLPADEHGRVDLRAGLQRLYSERGVSRLLVEGGGELTGQLQALDLIDEWHLFIAPLWLGSGAKSAIGSQLMLDRLESAQRLHLQASRRLESDLYLVLTK